MSNLRDDPQILGNKLKIISGQYIIDHYPEENSYFESVIGPYLNECANDGQFSVIIDSWSKSLGKEIFNSLLANLQIYRLICKFHKIKLEMIRKNVSITRTSFVFSWI